MERKRARSTRSRLTSSDDNAQSTLEHANGLSLARPISYLYTLPMPNHSYSPSRAPFSSRAASNYLKAGASAPAFADLIHDAHVLSNSISIGARCSPGRLQARAGRLQRTVGSGAEGCVRLLQPALPSS